MKKATASMALKRYELVETWHISVLSCVIPCYNDSTLSRDSIRSLCCLTIETQPIEGILAHIVPVAGGKFARIHSPPLQVSTRSFWLGAFVLLKNGT
mgnify:CR=1 FL=1